MQSIKPNPKKNYYGITVANGMLGIVSSPEAFKVKDVVLAGAYDLYGRGRVSNFIRSFNLLNIVQNAQECDASKAPQSCRSLVQNLAFCIKYYIVE